MDKAVGIVVRDLSAAPGAISSTLAPAAHSHGG